MGPPDPGFHVRGVTTVSRGLKYVKWKSLETDTRVQIMRCSEWVMRSLPIPLHRPDRTHPFVQRLHVSGVRSTVRHHRLCQSPDPPLDAQGRAVTLALGRREEQKVRPEGEGEPAWEKRPPGSVPSMASSPCIRDGRTHLTHPLPGHPAPPLGVTPSVANVLSFRHSLGHADTQASGHSQ